MNPYIRKLVIVLTTLLATAGFAKADVVNESYGEIFARKLGSGLANMATSPLEFPKNMINNGNQSNFIYGIAGGAIEGSLDTAGRMATGILDLLTSPLPTRPAIYPLFIWEDFNTPTNFGPIFRMEDFE